MPAAREPKLQELYQPGETRSQGRSTARNEHVKEALEKLAVGNIDEAINSLNKARGGNVPGPVSGAGAISEAQAVDWGLRGLTHTEIAKILGVTTRSWKNWRDERPELEKSYQQGKGLLAQGMKQALIQSASRGDTRALVFALKNWGGMSDKVEAVGQAPDQEVKITFTRDDAQPDGPPEGEE